MYSPSLPPSPPHSSSSSPHPLPSLSRSPSQTPSLSPLPPLPSELFFLILLSLPQSPLTPLLLVSKSWYSFIVSHPPLWKSLDIGLNYDHRFRLQSAVERGRGVEEVRVWLEAGERWEVWGGRRRVSYGDLVQVGEVVRKWRETVGVLEGGCCRLGEGGVESSLKTLAVYANPNTITSAHLLNEFILSLSSPLFSSLTSLTIFTRLPSLPLSSSILLLLPTLTTLSITTPPLPPLPLPWSFGPPTPPPSTLRSSSKLLVSGSAFLSTLTSLSLTGVFLGRETIVPEIRGLKELRLKEVTWEGRGVFLLLRWCRGGLRRCELEGFSMGDEEEINEAEEYTDWKDNVDIRIPELIDDHFFTSLATTTKDVITTTTTPEEPNKKSSPTTTNTDSFSPFSCDEDEEEEADFSSRSSFDSGRGKGLLPITQLPQQPHQDQQEEEEEGRFSDTSSLYSTGSSISDPAPIIFTSLEVLTITQECTPPLFASLENYYPYKSTPYPTPIFVMPSLHTITITDLTLTALSFEGQPLAPTTDENPLTVLGRNCPNLQVLRIRNCLVGDEGIFECLASLTGGKLRELDLRETDVGDRLLCNLVGLVGGLEEINLRGTEVTVQGVARFVQIFREYWSCFELSDSSSLQRRKIKKVFIDPPLQSPAPNQRDKGEIAELTAYNWLEFWGVLVRDEGDFVGDGPGNEREWRRWKKAGKGVFRIPGVGVEGTGLGKIRFKLPAGGENVGGGGSI